MAALVIDKEKVELLMKEAEIDTLSDLAKIAGLHPNTLTKVLRGENWTSETAAKLAMALNCNPLDVQTAHGYGNPKSRTLVVLSTLEASSLPILA